MYGDGKSDRLIVAVKRSNKGLRCAVVGGERGAKRPDQGEFVSAKQVLDTVAGTVRYGQL